MWALAFQVSVLGSLSNIVVMSLIKGTKPDPPFLSSCPLCFWQARGQADGNIHLIDYPLQGISLEGQAKHNREREPRLTGAKQV